MYIIYSLLSIDINNYLNDNQIIFVSSRYQFFLSFFFTFNQQTSIDLLENHDIKDVFAFSHYI